MSEFCCIILQFSSAGQCCSAVGAKTLRQLYVPVTLTVRCFRLTVSCLGSKGRWTSWSSTLHTWSRLPRRYLSAASSRPSPQRRQISVAFFDDARYWCPPGGQQRHRGCLGRRGSRSRGNGQVPACRGAAAVQPGPLLPRHHCRKQSR